MMSQPDGFQRVYSGAKWEQKVGYCRAVRAGDHVYVTGTASVDDQGEVHGVGDPQAQAARCLALIERAVLGLGGTKRSIVRTRMFVVDIELWERFGRAHADFFQGHHPATTMVEVSRLIHQDLLIEIEADAYLGP